MRSAAASKSKSPKKLSFSAGVTQLELVIAVAIISVFFLALTSAFTPIAKGIMINRGKTLAGNLAQEQIEKLKSVSYYRMLVTANPTLYPDPAVYYDPDYYPPERILAGGIWFDRLTFVEVAKEVAGEVQTLGPTTTDTGMKLVTTTIAWGNGETRQSIQLRNLVTNPEMVSSNAVFTGIVQTASSTPIQGAEVHIAENTGWFQTTGVNGSYTLNVLAGTYYLVASAPGYFTSSVQRSITDNVTLNVPFTLTAMLKGTVRGTVWTDNHLVISQVVGSSVSVSGFDQEYVELFNPTTSAIQIASGGAPLVDLYYHGEFDASSRWISLDFVRETAPAQGYYLIANTTTISVAGINLTADAVYQTSNAGYPNIILAGVVDTDPNAGGIGITNRANGLWYDLVGWERDPMPGAPVTPALYEGMYIDQDIGLQVEEQYVRRVSTEAENATLLNTYGRCYDSGYSEADFFDRKPITYPPRNSLSGTFPVVAGIPTAGAAITVDDGVSSGTTSYLQGTPGSNAAPPYAQFILPNVATGTWTGVATGALYMAQISSISLTASGQTVYIPNSATSPTWPATNYSSVILNDDADQGYVSGRVTNATGGVISNPAITVTNNTNSIQTNSSGHYLLSMSPGTWNMTANPNGGNPAYVEQTQSGIVVNRGSITSDVDFVLSQGGFIRGYSTRDGANPLPGVLYMAVDSNDVSRAQEVSGTNGYFNLTNLSTGTYTIAPVLDSGETSSPASVSKTVTSGTTIWASTFTISGSFGWIAGSVTYASQPVKTGVLIVATHDTLAGSPPALPALSSSTLTGNAYYSGSSTEDGTFRVDVRGSTNTAYNIYAYYPILSGNTVSTKYATSLGKFVTAGSSATANFSVWLP